MENTELTPSHASGPTDGEKVPDGDYSDLELLMQLHAEFYSGPKASANAFRILPRIVEELKKGRGDGEMLDWLEKTKSCAFCVVGHGSTRDNIETMWTVNIESQEPTYFATLRAAIQAAMGENK